MNTSLRLRLSLPSGPRRSIIIKGDADGFIHITEAPHGFRDERIRNKRGIAGSYDLVQELLDSQADLSLKCELTDG